MRVDTEKTSGAQNPHGLSISTHSQRLREKQFFQFLGDEILSLHFILCVLVSIFL